MATAGNSKPPKPGVPATAALQAAFMQVRTAMELAVGAIDAFDGLLAHVETNPTIPPPARLKYIHGLQAAASARDCLSRAIAVLPEPAEGV